APALRVAHRMLCEASDEARRPCGACAACRWFLAGNHPDFRRIEPEILWQEVPDKPSRVIKIEQIRELADFLNVKSHRGGLRIALIHPADDMQLPAASAPLNSLEEPPAGAG